MTREHVTSAQRAGIFLSSVEAMMFAFVAALHFGFVFEVRATTFAAPFLYPAAIVEAVLALGLVLAVLLPGSWSVRAGRTMAAQILVVIGVFAGQVALMRGPMLTTLRNEIFYGAALVLSIGSLALLASPGFRRTAPRT